MEIMKGELEEKIHDIWLAYWNPEVPGLLVLSLAFLALQVQANNWPRGKAKGTMRLSQGTAHGKRRGHKGTDRGPHTWPYPSQALGSCPGVSGSLLLRYEPE